MKVLQEIKVAQESVNDQYLTVVGILFNTGDKVGEGDIIIELESSKAVIDIEAEVEGYIEYLCKNDDKVAVNSTIVKIWDEKVVAAINETNLNLGNEQENVNTSDLKQNSYKGEYETVFSLKALQLIKDNGLAREIFNHLDFVNDEVVLEYLNPEKKSQTISNKRVQSNIPKLKEETLKLDFNKVTVRKINTFKRREIEYLSDVQHGGLVSVINIDLDIENFFKSVNESLKYFKDSALPIIIYECSRLLVKYPVFNAFYTNQEIAFYNNIDLGIAMDIDDGLKVVRIPDTNKLHLFEVEEKLLLLTNKYLDKKLETSDLTDISFTITDLSSFGAYSFTPLINKNNSAILGISKVDYKLNRIILSLAFDHRVTEGKMATLFLQELKERFESYSLLVMKEDIIKNISCCRCLKTLDEDLNDTGFIKIVNKKGEDKYICDVCLLNF